MLSLTVILLSYRSWSPASMSVSIGPSHAPSAGGAVPPGTVTTICPATSSDPGRSPNASASMVRVPSSRSYPWTVSSDMPPSWQSVGGAADLVPAGPLGLIQGTVGVVEQCAEADPVRGRAGQADAHGDRQRAGRGGNDLTADRVVQPP